MEELIRKLVRTHKTNCPFKLAQRHNIKVWFEDLPADVRGFHLRKLRRRYIAINNNLSYEWQRFVCAHELGHDRIHKESLGYYFIKQNTLFNPGRYERQANEFAVKLLTSGEERYEDETDETYCARNGVPRDMIKYL